MEIRINDECITEWPLSKRRRQLSLVGQQVNLFDASVADNIRFGWPDASEADVREAARQAHALEFIEALPNGFDTQIGSFGNRLSGGQRQRIAIARIHQRCTDSVARRADQCTRQQKSKTGS